jgi:hypothetical protein
MGYCVDIEINNVEISAEHICQCMGAINGLNSKDNYNIMGGGRGDGSIKWFSWVSYPENGLFSRLVDAFDGWRYDAKECDNGGVALISFDGEKWGDDEILYKTIAPFVKSSGEILVRGEDGAVWKYVFNDGKVKRFDGSVIFGDARDI